ncbi:MAG: hypothetical protein R3C14_42660 [Caldilineaceae bacterium]
MLAQIKEHRPITKGARSAVYRAIGQLFQAVPVAPSSYGWLSLLLNQNTFRHLLAADEVRRGFLMLDELEHAIFFPQFFQTYQPDSRKLTIELFGGPTIEAEAYIERKTWSLRLGKEFVEWIDLLGGQGRDDILIHVLDATAGRYLFRLQPRELRDLNAIQGRNIQLALLAEELVTEDRRSRVAIPTAELAAKIVGRGFYNEPVPPDDFHFVLHQYSLLRFHNGVGYSFDPEAIDYAADGAAADMMRTPDALPEHPLEWEFFAADPPFEPEDADMAFWDEDEEDLFSDSCASYEAYMASAQELGSGDDLLCHADFHLLEAELEMLIALEQEFGYLLPEQQARRDQLIERLFIDPETLLDGDQDLPDYPDYEDPPFWEN